MAEAPAVRPDDTASPLKAEGATRSRWRVPALLVLSGVAALVLGFRTFTPALCDTLVRRLGFSWVVILLAGVGVALHAVARERGGWKAAARAALPRGRALIWILLTWGWLMRMDPPGYKVLFDEPVLAATAYTLHLEREFATTSRNYEIGGFSTIVQTYLDKRPPVFPVIVSLVHDLTGYRLANLWIVNGAATLLLVWLVWWSGRRLGAGEGAGVAALAWVATVPILGINATSAGMDLFNVLMVAAWFVAVVLYLAVPTAARCALLVFTALLLAYCRYESVLYACATGGVWLVGCWRARARHWHPVLALLPLGLVLYGWHSTMLSHSPELWELRPGQTHRFSAEYAPNNLEHAGIYFFRWTWKLANSPALAWLGLAGAAVLLVRFRRLRPDELALGVFAAVVGVQLTLIIFYYWGELDDPIVSRLSLPAHLWLALAAIGGWRVLQERWPRQTSWRWLTGGAGLALVAHTVPVVAADRVTTPNLIRRNYEYEEKIISAYWPRPGLLIGNRSTLCWLAQGWPAISLDRARGRERELRWHLDRHSFGTVLVMQRVLTLGGTGGWAVDATDTVPEHWQLEEVTVKRIGLTLTRISRLVAVKPASLPAEPAKP